MRIGFIGIGQMGRHMARNVAEGGHDLTVYDIRKEAADELLSIGSVWADSPGAVAEVSEVVFTSLPSPQNVEQVAIGESGILSGAAPGTVYFDLSTTDPDTMRRIADRGDCGGVSVLDAPVSGGIGRAEKRTLSVMVGGDKAVFERYKPILDLIGDKAMYCGGIGSGAVCKIVNNLIATSLEVLLAEAFTLGIRNGVDTGTLFEAISRSSGDTWAMHAFSDYTFKGNFEPGFQLDLAAKDVGLATEMGRRLSVPMELANLVHQRYIEAQNRGLGKMSHQAVACIQEKRAGVEIRM